MTDGYDHWKTTPPPLDEAPDEPPADYEEGVGDALLSRTPAPTVVQIEEMARPRQTVRVIGNCAECGVPLVGRNDDPRPQPVRGERHEWCRK